jgi:hypothetical protein
MKQVQIPVDRLASDGRPTQTGWRIPIQEEARLQPFKQHAPLIDRNHTRTMAEESNHDNRMTVPCKILTAEQPTRIGRIHPVGIWTLGVCNLVTGGREQQRGNY